MIDKGNEHSPKNKALKAVEESETEVPKFKFLYRNVDNSEKDKSSGASSDEETVSSSIIPIPVTLKRMRNKLQRVMDGDEHTEYVSEVLEKPTDTVTNSLEEFRKKYTLKNENSVAMKMNSANLILDDILNSTNLNLTTNNHSQTRFLKKQEINSKALSFMKTNEVNESSNTESSSSVTKHYPPIIGHSHPIGYDLFPSPYISHESFLQPLNDSVERENLVCTPKKKTLLEKIQDLRLTGKIQSVYRSFQRTRNPFAKGGGKQEVMKIQQGIPGVDYRGNEQAVYKYENHPKQLHAKRLKLDLVESSELSQSESKSTEWEVRHCTCTNQRECDCPEVIPQCKCMTMYSETNFKNTKNNIPNSEDHKNYTNDYLQEMQSSRSASPTKEPSKLLPKDAEDFGDKKKNNLVSKHLQETKKHCSQERRIIERTDIYYFDHGNSAYYQTTDNHPMRYTECLVERTDHYATKFWAEFFGSIEIGIAFLISFFIQFYRFFFTSIIRPLTVGLLQISSDYFFKPLLTIIFNGIIQPCLILAYNIATSTRDLCLPISQIFGYFAKEVAVIIRSCRLVEVNREKPNSCYCGNRV